MNIRDQDALVFESHTLIFRPSGVDHCRKQFQYFPCCDLKSGKAKGVEKLDECEETILQQFNKGQNGHFSCDDLIKDDREALFFFIKEIRGAAKDGERTNLTYQCTSVCHSGGSRGAVVGALMPIVTLIVSVLCSM